MRQSDSPVVVILSLLNGLRHALYGKKSEKLDTDERQLAFEDLEVAVAENEAAIEQQPTPEGTR